MRNVMLAASALGVLALTGFVASAASDPYSDAARLQPGLPDSPSGKGDPDSITCRAPQRLADGTMGAKVCIHNNVWARLSLTGTDLSADGKTVIDRPLVEEPLGDGNPDAVTCRKPQELGNAWRLKTVGPKICLTNQDWAQLKTERKRITEDGKSVVDTRQETSPIPGTFGQFGSATISALPSRVVH